MKAFVEEYEKSTDGKIGIIEVSVWHVGYAWFMCHLDDNCKYLKKT